MAGKGGEREEEEEEEEEVGEEQEEEFLYSIFYNILKYRYKQQEVLK